MKAKREKFRKLETTIDKYLITTKINMCICIKIEKKYIFGLNNVQVYLRFCNLHIFDYPHVTSEKMVLIIKFPLNLKSKIMCEDEKNKTVNAP